MLHGELMTSAVVLPFSFEMAADSLMASGLQADKAELMRRLQVVGEYRFAAYADYFRSGSGYAPGTTLEKVWRLHEFDHRLRVLCFEAIGNIETQVRSQLAYRFAQAHNPLDYLDQANFPNFSSNIAFDQLGRWENKIREATDSLLKESAQAVPSSHRTSANPQPQFPIWVIAERMDFGMVLSFFPRRQFRYSERYCQYGRAT